MRLAGCTALERNLHRARKGGELKARLAGIGGVRLSLGQSAQKYIVRPTFGIMAYPIFFSLAAWNKLTNRQKKLPLLGRSRSRRCFFVEWIRLADEEPAKLKGRGAQITEVGADKKDKLNKALVTPCLS